MRNNAATKTSQSGTYAIGTPEAKAAKYESIAPAVHAELEKRLASLPLEQLVRLLTNAEALEPPAAPSLTVRGLIRKVLGSRSMRSQEVVAAVQQLRPGTPGPTVRSDLSRMRAEGLLAAVGPVRGGKLRAR